jgi:hypothetical protein
MSFNRLNYDDCTYQHNLTQSVGVGDYMLNTPSIECLSCFPKDPQTQSQKGGVSSCDQYKRVDVDSELLGITRKASNCPSQKYVPFVTPTCEIVNMPDCKSLPNEGTRISNPPATLRCTGWNRWEWLCQNPQDKALVPFDFNVNYRLVAKDNHRPCLPTPISQVPSLPKEHFSDDVYQPENSCQQAIKDIPSVHWRNCKTYEVYGA